MNRRDTVLALLALGAAPLAARAQQPSKPARIGVLAFSSPESTVWFLVDVLKQRLRELNYIEGKNVVFEVRAAHGKAERLPDLAQELVALQPDVIFATTGICGLAAQKATATIPIVVTGANDPIGSGFAKSLAHPGGNVTGFTYLQIDSSPKLLEFAATAVPKLSRVAVLWNSAGTAAVEGFLQNLRSAAQIVGVNIVPLEARTPAEIESAFARMVPDRVGAVIVAGDVLFLVQRRQIAELASRNRMPSVFQFREHVEAGGLMSYGQNLVESYLRAATYVDKILKGTKPGDLPFEQSRTLELVVNLKTAKALGLTIPQSLLIRADRVIE